MQKINTDSWQEFKVGNLFKIKPTKAYKYTNAKLLDDGPTPVVVNSSYNNGIGGYSSYAATEKGNMITFSDTVDANTIFYQATRFIGYPHVQGLYPHGDYAKCWNEKRLKFFATVFRKAALTKGFDYGNKFRRDIAVDLTVKLPVDCFNQLNWKYMEEYIEDVEDKVSNRISLLNKEKQQHKINIENWEIYRIGELFRIVKGTRLTKANMIPGDTNFIGASSFNNGITARIGNTQHVHPANTITVNYNGSVGQAFYQPNAFWASDDVNVLYPKFEMTPLIAMFFLPIIRQVGKKYAFIDKWELETMKKDEIRLPTKGNQPDWEYMTRYMRELKLKIKKDVEIYRKIK